MPLPQKTAKELGFKVGDRFTVVGDDCDFCVGEVVTLTEDDGTRCPFFKNESGLEWWCYFSELEPYSEPVKAEPRSFKKGDRVKVISHGARHAAKTGWTGTVEENNCQAPWVNFDNGERWPVLQSRLGLIEEDRSPAGSDIPEVGRTIQLNTVSTPSGEPAIGRVHSVEVRTNLDNYPVCRVVVRGLEGYTEYTVDDLTAEGWKYVDKKLATGGMVSNTVNIPDYPRGLLGMPITPYFPTFILRDSKPYTLSKGDSIMSKLSLLAKKVFDKDTQTLIKAGVLDTDLNVQNHQFILAFVVEQYKKELAALAQEQLDESKNDC